MSIYEGSYLKRNACFSLMTLAMVGCASFAHGEAVKDGDKVGIHFTCRLPNGEVASTTRKEVVFDKALKKSPILLTVIGDKPIEVTAGEPPHMSPLTTPGLEEEIIRQLTLYSVGMKEGEKRSVKLTAETVPVRGSEQQKLVMPRIWHRPKLVHMLKDVYRTNARKEPKVGENYSGDAPLEGKVTAVTDKEVIIAFSAKPGSTIRTAYGVGTVMEKDDRFDILIDVKPGSLIRTDLLVGKVTEVGAEDFTLDYSNPFFGETLSCDFSVMELQKEGEESPAAATPATKSKPAPMAKEEGATTSQEHTKAVAKQLESVIADAAKSGKKSVDIEVDQLPYLVAEGDLVTVQFSARNSDGTTLTLPEGAPKFDISQEVVAGKQEIFPGLGESVVGMLIGEKKEVTLPPEKAFGIHDPAKMVSYPVKNTIPSRMKMPAEEYVKRFGGFPVAGKEVPVLPYLKAKVENVGEKDVTLSVSAKDGDSFDETFGKVTVSVGPDAITLKLVPRLGALFNTGDRRGIITTSTSDSFTVDYNDPLAGKAVVLNLKTISITKKADLKTEHIDWIEDRDAGLARAKQEGKPLFLILYADWCGWCKKTFTETLPDPRIGKFRDKFVWMKLNSDKEKKYKQMYEQKGYPMIVIFRPDGTVLKKIEGYRDVRALKNELELALATGA